MAYAPKPIPNPFTKAQKPFERVRLATDFDYNGRKWRDKTRAPFLACDPDTGLPRLCIHCEAKGIATVATVADHEPPAKQLIARGLDPYDWQYLQPLCKRCHDAKSGRERHL